MNKSKFSSKKTHEYLARLPATSVAGSNLIARTKFNFSFLDMEQPPKLSSDLTKAFFDKLFDKLKQFSSESLAHWNAAPAGRGNGNYLEVYGRFPKPSEFFHPPFVPHDAVWGRFRVDRTTRLVGFTIPGDLNHKFCENERYRYCINTFYIVFLDIHHKFYVTK